MRQTDFMTNTVNLEAIIPVEMSGLRLDQALARLFSQYSRGRLQDWIKAGQVKVDGKLLRPRDAVQAGQCVVINATLVAQEQWEAQAIALNIVYEDETIIVLNKPAGLVVHPGAGNRNHTLLNALLHHAPELAELPRAGIVHRLDKDTSGLLVIARTLQAHQALIRAMQRRQIKREYLALVQGILISGGTVEEPIGRHPTQRMRMAVIHSGKRAITHYRVIERFPQHTLLRVELDTGRTHQIRVHMAHIQHSIVGDPTYAGRLKLPAGASEALKTGLITFKRQALHARHLAFLHPLTQQPLSFEAPIPDDLQGLLELLREDMRKLT